MCVYASTPPSLWCFHRPCPCVPDDDGLSTPNHAAEASGGRVACFAAVAVCLPFPLSTTPSLLISLGKAEEGAGRELNEREHKGREKKAHLNLARAGHNDDGGDDDHGGHELQLVPGSELGKGDLFSLFIFFTFLSLTSPAVKSNQFKEGQKIFCRGLPFPTGRR